jgi:hypothetical protein
MKDNGHKWYADDTDVYCMACGCHAAHRAAVETCDSVLTDTHAHATMGSDRKDK